MYTSYTQDVKRPGSGSSEVERYGAYPGLCLVPIASTFQEGF